MMIIIVKIQKPYVKGREFNANARKNVRNINNVE
jgi:hypothetical protein